MHTKSAGSEAAARAQLALVREHDEMEDLSDQNDQLDQDGQLPHFKFEYFK